MEIPIACVNRKENVRLRRGDDSHLNELYIVFPLSSFVAIKEYVNPCQPSPCGPNSQCRELNEQAVCSCLPEYVGAPPACRPECTISSECVQDKACVAKKCVDPCPGTCGEQALCRVLNHSPICSCRAGFTGDAFYRCLPIPRKCLSLPYSQFLSLPPRVSLKAAPPTAIVQKQPVDPCVPSPCGSYAQCRLQGDSPSCSCLPGYRGAPPNCRPECRINSDCPSSQACINEKCRDPCPGSCGFGAICNVLNHTPSCTCPAGYTGDPFSHCQPEPPPKRKQPQESLQAKLDPILYSLAVEADDPCNPSPCGPNAVCNGGSCSCLPEYQGDPYTGCRPECITSLDCPRDRACARHKCFDPCPGTCASNARCTVLNHIPMCTCPEGFAGNAFVQCQPIPRKYLEGI